MAERKNYIPNANCRIILRSVFFLVISLCCSVLLHAQYQVVGSAIKHSCSCYTLTPAQNTQNGSVWNTHTLNLNQDFDIAVDLFMGCADANGADGVAFVLQPQPTATGLGGGEMGYSGITPSIGIVLDTYQNGADGDPAYDHISININGDVSHLTANNLAGPVQAIFGNDNVEDCAWHLFRVTWNATLKQVSVYFGGALRATATVDLVANVFGGNPTVYWGMVGATGGQNNEQKFCARLIPGFATNIQGDSACIGGEVPFTPFVDALIPVDSYWWNFGDNTTSTQAIPPPHVYAATGVYTVSMVITGSDGCISDTFRRPVRIVDPPKVTFTIPPEKCAGARFKPVINVISSPGRITHYLWTVNSQPHPNSDMPDPAFRLNHGVHTIGLVVQTEYAGCESALYTQQIRVLPSPVVITGVDNGCVYDPIQMTGIQFIPEPDIVDWMWSFDTAHIVVHQQSPGVVFNWPGLHTGYLLAMGNNGCPSDTSRFSFTVNYAQASAGNDTIVLANEPFTLNGSGNGTFLWSPAFGLNDTHIPRPTGSLATDTTYTLNVITPEGCKASDKVRVTIFNGSKIFAPSAFTPNGDGLNEQFKAVFIGIKEIKVYNVYNRWGQLMFSSKDPNQAWDGRYRGQLQPAGNYVYIIHAVDFLNKALKKKGYFMLIK